MPNKSPVFESRFRTAGIMAAVCVLATGCTDTGKSPSKETPSGVRFHDKAESNAPLDSEGLETLTFTNAEGKTVALKSFLGKGNLVLIITRGYTGSICPYCSTQTSRLIANYEKFQKRDAEVLVVFPVASGRDRDRWQDLRKSALAELSSSSTTVPFPIILDVELAAVGRLGIRSELAKPSTYIIDKKGQLRFAYVDARPRNVKTGC